MYIVGIQEKRNPGVKSENDSEFVVGSPTLQRILASEQVKNRLNHRHPPFFFYHLPNFLHTTLFAFTPLSHPLQSGSRLIVWYMVFLHPSLVPSSFRPNIADDDGDARVSPNKENLDSGFDENARRISFVYTEI